MAASSHRRSVIRKHLPGKKTSFSLPLGLARKRVRVSRGMADSTVQQLEQRVGAVSLEQPLQSSCPSTSPTTAPSGAAAAQSPVNATNASPGPPPALSPRASAPAAAGSGSGSAPRKPTVGGGAGSAHALRQGVRGAVGTGGGPLKMPPSLAAKMAAVRFLHLSVVSSFFSV